MKHELHLLSALPFACLILGRRGEVQHLNSAAEDLLQRSQKALSKQSVKDIFVASPPLLSLLDAVQARGANVRGPHIQIEVPNAEPRIVSVDVCPLDGDRCLLVMIPEAADTNFARADALKTRAGSLTAMAGMLAHEIKNPLAAISGAAQLMASSNETLANLIVSESNRITQLLDTMELFSSPDEVDVGPVNIHAVMGEVRQVAKHTFGSHVQFVEDYDPSLPLVQANAHVLHRVFLNLVKNACEAGGRGTQIRMKTRYQLSQRRRVTGERARVQLPLIASIVDNGPGINADMRDKIFDAFISTKDQGRGLGLAYVAGAVASLDGSVEVKSAPGQTEFQLRLPQA